MPRVTRARPTIDRIACPWLIKRSVDADADRFRRLDDDHAQLSAESVVYDALDASCRAQEGDA